MEELLKTINYWLKEKTSSSIYLTFVLYYVIWNWKFFYILFIEDTHTLKQPALEYVSTLYFTFPSSGFIVIDKLAHFSLNSLYHIIVPLLLTYFSVKYLPIIYDWAYGLELDNHFKRKLKHQLALEAYEKKITKTINSIVVEKTEQRKGLDIIKEAVPEEEKWEQEFLSFKQLPIFKKFSQLVEVIYQHSGLIRYQVNLRWVMRVDVDILSYSEALNLIVYDKKDHRIDFTDKGRYFLLAISRGDISP